jgi:hypothetical protein
MKDYQFKGYGTKANSGKKSTLPVPLTVQKEVQSAFEAQLHEQKLRQRKPHMEIGDPLVHHRVPYPLELKVVELELEMIESLRFVPLVTISMKRRKRETSR